MSATVFEKVKGSRTWWVRFTIPRSRCVTESSRDRRTTVKVGPRTVATAIAEEANGLLNSAHLQDVPVRAKDLLRQAADQLRGRHQGASPVAAAITVAEYGPSWLDTTKGSTRHKYHIIFRKHIVPTFGAMPLNRIGKRLVREWLQGLESTLAPATAACYFSVFIAMLAQAVRDEEIRQHPCPSIRSIRSSQPKAAPREVRFLAYHELADLIRALRATETNFNRRGPIEFQAATGCRLGEARGLWWSDIDFDASQATIRRRIYDGEVGPTKGRNVTQVELGAGLIRDLRALRIEQKRRALACGRRAGKFVFQAPNGDCWRWCQPLREGVWRRGLIEAKLATKKTKLRKAGLATHVLRHTWATHRLQEGVPPPDVAKALGHGLPTLLKTYAHAMPTENRDRLRVDLDAIV